MGAPDRGHAARYASALQSRRNPAPCESRSAVLRKVVAQEAPLLMREAARRVGERWGFKRFVEKALERLRHCLPAADVVEVCEGDEHVLWPGGTDPASLTRPRVPLAGSDRPLSEVPLVELGVRLRFWIELRGPLSERVLFEHAARSFGSQKIGVQVRERLTAALRRAIAEGRLRRMVPSSS